MKLKALCFTCSQGWWFKTRKVKEVFKEEQAETLQQVLVGRSEDRSRSWRDAAVCLTLHMLLGAHGKSLDHQRMRCGPRLAPSWTCSDWIVELKWSHCEWWETLLPDPRLTAAPQELCIIAQKCLWHSIPGLTMISVGVLNICAVTIMHDVPGEEWVEEFEVIYLRL